MRSSAGHAVGETLALLRCERVHIKRRYGTEKAARAALAEMQNNVGGYFREPPEPDRRGGVGAVARAIKPTTYAACGHALAPLRERHGDLPVQKLTKASGSVRTRPRG
jgi:hypothetical protein